MTATTVRSTSTLRWIKPRQGMDPCQRRLTYGKLRPLDEDRSLLERLLGR